MSVEYGFPITFVNGSFGSLITSEVIDWTPATTIVVLIVFCSESSICVPHIMFASGANSSDMTCTIFSASCSVRSELPEMFISAPLALDMSRSSSGLCSAAFTDSSARSPESDSPIPIIAIPEPFIMLLMSAKSRLTSPFLVISSVIPFTARPSISSATVNDFSIGRLGATSSSLSFGITITVSAASFSFSSPFSAFSLLRIPSAENGSVATAMVSASSFLARLDMTGADPVPVPPPSPQVMNTMSDPVNFFLISSSLSSADDCPMFGSPPAPSPRQVSLPISSLLSDCV